MESKTTGDLHQSGQVHLPTPYYDWLSITQLLYAMPVCATDSRGSASRADEKESSAPALYDKSLSMPSWKRSAAAADEVVISNP